jgi:murein DD-endopeptidase MepM/ murein hydrolase activator NlpD
MDIILLNGKGSQPRTLHLPTGLIWSAGVLLLLVPLMIGVGSYWFAYRLAPPVYGPEVVNRWQQQVRVDQQALDTIRVQSQDSLHALMLKFADMQAKMVRLDALGERLVDVADIKSDEFDFSSEPAIGGPDAGKEISYQPPSFEEAVNDLAATLDRRQQQLNILNGLLQDKHLRKSTELAGRPIDHGWLSSRFGYRVDPFTGRLSFHPGIDFASKEGTPIHATAAGVVTWAGPRSGYGNMVQINHGNGLSTRYGHCETLLVKPGDIVKVGQEIALMGSTGRSTGPHVHYEVLKNGHQVNPLPYIMQARR